MASRVKYGKPKADEICKLMAKGMSPMDIAKRDDMPSYKQMLTWRDTYPYFCTEWCKAVVNRLEMLIEQQSDLPKQLADPEFIEPFGNAAGARGYISLQLKATQFQVKELKALLPTIHNMRNLLHPHEKDVAPENNIKEFLDDLKGE